MLPGVTPFGVIRELIYAKQHYAGLEGQFLLVCQRQVVQINLVPILIRIPVHLEIDG